MFQEIIYKLRRLCLHFVLKFNKSYKSEMMDSTKIYDKNIEMPNVRKRSVPEPFDQTGVNHQNLAQTKLSPGDTCSIKEPNGYYKGNNCNGDNHYSKNIYICQLSST